MIQVLELGFEKESKREQLIPTVELSMSGLFWMFA
jgi:hypothetical protein